VSPSLFLIGLAIGAKEFELDQSAMTMMM
jgi:hypothetical protein